MTVSFMILLALVMVIALWRLGPCNGPLAALSAFGNAGSRVNVQSSAVSYAPK